MMKRFTFAAAASALLFLLPGCGSSADPFALGKDSGGSAYPFKASYYDIQTIHAIWRHTPITYHIGTGVSKSVDFRALIDYGMKHWGPALAPYTILVEANDEASADIVINYVPQSSILVSEFMSSSNVPLGSTDTQYNAATNTITHATCSISENQDPATIVSEVVHETGHALGIHDHSLDFNDIMYRNLHYPATVSERDANTLKSLYDNRTNPAP